MVNLLKTIAMNPVNIPLPITIGMTTKDNKKQQKTTKGINVYKKAYGLPSCS